MGEISVFLNDWQVLFREGIHFTLSGEEDIEVIGEATDGGEALAFIEANSPDVAILNADHGEVSGVEITRRIRQNLPSVGVILIMDSYDEELLFSAIKSGAKACLTKDTDPEELLNIIRKIAQGGYLISEGLLKPEIASRVLEEFEVFASVSKEVDDLLARLSPRETDILRRIAEGASFELVTQALGISEEAVRHQLTFIWTKLVANDHNREVVEAAQKGLPSIIPRAGKPAVEYITKDEFTAFKESLRERLKSIGELG